MGSTMGRKRHLNDVDEHPAPYPSKQPRYTLEANNAASEDTNTAGKKKLTNGDYTVGWVAALSIERAAAEAMLDGLHLPLPRAPGDTNNYTFGEIGDHNVVIASLPHDGYGTINAATVAGNMHRTFPSLEVFLMVGIAGGAPGVDDVRLGDVVVSTELIQYDLGRALGEDRFETTAIPLRPSHELRNAITALRAQHEAKPSRIPDILYQIVQQNSHMKRYTSRESLQDLLFESAYEHPELESTCNQCDHLRLVKRTPRRSNDPVIHYGVIASGDQVIKYATTRDKLAQKFKALCFEMEGAGFIESLQCLVVRSICDYADSHKNKQWQRYAAATAAAYTKELLGKMPILETQASKIVEKGISQVQKWDLMNSLSFQSMYSRAWNIESAQYETCEWILQHPVYLTWLDLGQYSKSRGFLWIRGKPGAGKSTLMKFISTHASENHPTVVSFFFNARGGDLEKSVEGMYRSLLHQLLDKVPNLQLLDHPHLRLLASSRGFEWTISMLQELFSKAITGLGPRELVCFVDALDECNVSELWKMVKYFENLGSLALEKKLKLFICFSSRHYPSITIKNSLTLVLEDQYGHGQDLKEYVNQELDIGEEEDALDIRTTLLKKAAGVFLWVVLVVRILNEDCLGGRIFGLKARLDEIPSELHNLFKDILKKDSKNGADLLLSIQWILYAGRPLELEEYYYAMVAGLNPREDSLAERDPKKVTIDMMIQFVSSSSKGLAEVTKSDNSTVQFIHESVRDFLIKDSGTDELWPELGNELESKSHDRLKNCCHAYVKARSFDMEKLDSVREVDDYTMRGGTTKYPFLEYATEYVLYHANIAAVSISQKDFLKIFDLRPWIKAHNFFIRHESDSFTPSANIFYILADQGFAWLIDSATALYGPRVHVHGELWQYPLFAALDRDHKEAADAILRAANSRADSGDSLPRIRLYTGTFDLQGYTPLTLATQARHIEAIQFLLDQGLSPNILDDEGQTPLGTAIETDNIEVAQLLLDTGAEVDLADPLGRTPLSMAAKYNRLQAIQLLLDRGAEVNSRDEVGRTPLLYAAMGGCLQAIQLLLGKGAEVDSKANNGQTPLFFAAEGGHLDIIQELLNRGAEVDPKAKNSETPLFSAVITKDWRYHDGRYKSLDTTQLLLDNGAEVNSISENSETPLTRAICFGSKEVVELLLARGADVNVINRDGITPLQLAVEGEDEEIAELLRASSSQIPDLANNAEV
ncbi:ankyrin repeat-containing domain protein [Xylaria acuta]|nr:ankyrin repeat-containing domain protein [Xylaria acuta]